VQRIEWFPKTGHLLLSGSMDHTVKIWEAYGQRKCLRSYMGHSEAVRDMCFSADGTKFWTASYDKFVKVWDTETGQVISRHTTKKIPYCVRVHPTRPDEFLVGQSNKKIVQVHSSAHNAKDCQEDGEAVLTPVSPSLVSLSGSSVCAVRCAVGRSFE
jgi:pre-mRNA-processing factor 17